MHNIKLKFLEEELEGWVKGRKPSFNPKESAKPKFYKQEYGKTGTFIGQQYEFEFMAREEWGAAKPLFEDVFSELVADVVIGYTDTEECHNVYECAVLVKDLQTKHMEEGQPDIRHNFLIAGDGQVYEGRGWHTKPPLQTVWPEVADCSINFAYIGKKGHFPPKPLAKVAFQLMDFGSTNQCLQTFTAIWFDYFDRHHDVVAEMDKNPGYNNEDPSYGLDDETIHLQRTK